MRAALLLLPIAAAGCGGGDGPSSSAAPPTAPQPTIASVSIDQPSPSITVRQAVTLTAAAHDASGAAIAGAPAWSSSDTVVATVSSGGIVAGIRAGSATITATIGGKSASANLTVRAGALPLRGVWTLFEHLGAQAGYYQGQMLRQFDSLDASAGTTVGVQVAQQMDAMRALGINAISLQVVGADSAAGDGRPPVCSVNPILGARWPQPTPLELTNLVKLFDLAQQKGIRVLLDLSHTHFEESPPANATQWLTAMINAVKNHPALELVTFMGDVHVNNFGAPSCGLPAEPPLWLGPGGVVYQHLKFEMGLARSLGLDPRKISAEAIVGDYATQVQTTQPGTNHLYAPIVTLRQLFDDLTWPDAQRTYALSFYLRRKCEAGTAPPGCADVAPAEWADQTMRYVFSTIGAANGARAVAIEYGVYPDGASTPEQAVAAITNVMRQYGADGGAYWTWVETDNTYEAGLPFLEAVVRRGATLQYNPVKDAIVKAYGAP